MTERDLIEKAQDQLQGLKRTMRELQKVNADAGRDGAANACMGLRGKLLVWHADATVEMNNWFPEFAGAIQARAER